MAVLHTEGDTVTADTLEFDEEPLANDVLLWLWRRWKSRKSSVALEQADGNRKLAAELLGIGRTTLYSKMKLFGIDNKEQDKNNRRLGQVARLRRGNPAARFSGVTRNVLSYSNIPCCCHFRQ